MKKWPKKHARIKQMQSAIRSINLTTIVASSKKQMSMFTEEEFQEFILEGLNMARMKYGLDICLEVIPFIIQKFKTSQKVKIKIQDGREVDVIIRYDPLQKFYDNFINKPIKNESTIEVHGLADVIDIGRDELNFVETQNENKTAS